MFVVRSLKVLNWESLLAIEQIVESKKTMKSIHTSWTIAFGNALIPCTQWARVAPISLYQPQGNSEYRPSSLVQTD